MTIFIKFTKLTNYCWMLCEGLYLYRLIVRAFREQTNWVRFFELVANPYDLSCIMQVPFYLVGWILPIMAMIPYIVIHSIEVRFFVP